MHKVNYKPLALALMLGGLILLLAFLSLFLRQSYEEAYKDLKNDVDRLFLNAVREVEDSVLQNVFLEPLKLKRVDVIGEDFSTDIKTVRIETLPDESDSSKTLIEFPKRVKKGLNFEQTIIQSEEEYETVTQARGDTTISVTINSNTQKGETDITGSLSFFLAVSGDSIQAGNWVNDANQPLTLVLPELKTRFRKAFEASGIPVEWEMIALNELDPEQAGLISRPYTDLISGEQNVVLLSRIRPYLLRSIAPEILFSGILFLSIGLAFLLIWRTILNQSRLITLKNDFISNITHELKTPITTVGVAIEALRNFDALKDPEKTLEYLDISKQELNRLSLLVDKVLRISLFEKQAPELRYESFDLKSLIQDVINSMKLQFENLSARVDFKTSGDSFMIEADRIHLSAVIYNLIDNALKYRKGNPEIDLSLANLNNTLELKVKDRGIGISREFLDKIFDKFFRVPQGNKHDVKGYGLGLSYVASVVKEHGGKIQVESEPDQGTCFTLKLPIRHDKD